MVMGKNIISQRRGRGSSTYRVRPLKLLPRMGFSRKPGCVVDIVRHTLRKSPIAVIRNSDGTTGYMPASEGMRVGDDVARFAMPLSHVPVGKKVFAIESIPNEGPRFCLSPGSAAVLLSREGSKVRLKMPSKEEKIFKGECYALIGVPAGEGRAEKPFMNAGRRSKLMKSTGKLYPRTSAVNMNAVDHPFGGSGTGKKKPPVSRDAPPGAKVGAIAPRRTGRRKR